MVDCHLHFYSDYSLKANTKPKQHHSFAVTYDPSTVSDGKAHGVLEYRRISPHSPAVLTALFSNAPKGLEFRSAGYGSSRPVRWNPDSES